jgi:hypothetical protein|tara:strand:- start:1646 stop:5038 length:3393 start_codon:yes stop_codon:yes gene_type:complete
MADIITEQSNNPDGDKGVGIFKSAMSALRGGKRITPNTIGSQGMPATAVLPPSTQQDHVEGIQQQFLDWQVSKINENIYTRTLYYDTDRIAAYQDFRAMDMSPEISAALDILRDECLTRGENGKILQIYSENGRIQSALEDLFNVRLNMNYNARMILRDLMKYGDFYMHLHIAKGDGVYNFRVLPGEEVRREPTVTGDDGTDSEHFRWETMGMDFEFWQVAHFRLLEDSRRLPYGRSILDSARKLWKQLQLAEDAMLVYRLVRAPERRIFYIEVGNLEEQDVEQFMMGLQHQLKKQPIVNQGNGDTNYKYDPLNVTEDYFIPIRDQKMSKIETLPGACLALDTKIPLLDGRNLELGEIIEEFENNDKQLWSYSINPENGKVVPGMITWAGVTRKNTQVLKLTFDNGESVTVTPDHKFPTRFRGTQEAQDLKEGDSMWSFEKRYRNIKGAGKKRKRNTYEQVWDHESKSWEYTHRMVHGYMQERGLHEEFEYKSELCGEDKNTIHHADFNRYNNSPENLLHMNGKDHFCYHHDNMSRLVEFFGEETVESWKDDRRAGLKEYWANISEEELRKKGVTARVNFMKGTEKLQELMRDPEYKKDFYIKQRVAYKAARQTPESRHKSSIATSKQWSNGSLREAIKEKQEINYNDVMLQFVVSRYQDGCNAADILSDINAVGSEFMVEFNAINKGNKQLKKMSSFTHNNMVKMMKSFGYSNWRDFTKKAELFNHKLVSIEWLDEPQDTGTITVDGNHKLHDYHNFALSVGVFTQNSNLGDIQDIEYLEKKLFASLKVPKAYLNYTEALPGGSTLSQADLRFARTVNSIQEAFLMELRRIASIHLHFLGFAEDELEKFDLKLNNPSSQQELLKLETMKARVEVFKEYFTSDASSPVSYTWAMENLLGFSKTDIKLLLKQKKIEKRLFAEIDAGVETYKKTGLFSDIDAIYELPNAEEIISGTGGGEEGGGDEGGSFGGGGGSFGGGGDFGGDVDFGGAEDLGGVDGVDIPNEPAEELAERVRRHRRLQEQATKNTNNLLDELLGSDEKEVEIIAETIKDQLDSQHKSFGDAKRLLDSLERDVDLSEAHTVMNAYDQGKNPLLTKHEILVKKSQALINEIENLNTEEFDGYIEEIDINE